MSFQLTFEVSDQVCSPRKLLKPYYENAIQVKRLTLWAIDYNYIQLYIPWAIYLEG